jgi:hypothetical protein
MKKLLIVLACVLLAGCDYTEPLVKSPQIAIDRSALGLWQRAKDDGQTEQLLVLPLGEREYLVSFPSGSKNAMFARACLFRIAGRTLVQLKWLGTAAGNLPKDNRVFQYATYSVAGDKITVRLLNSELVRKDLVFTDDLAKAIVANKNDPHLFKENMIFTKVGN